MPRRAVEDNHRVSLRVRPSDKATLMRASALVRTDLTEFMVRAAVREAEAVIERHEQLALSARDSLRVLELLESSPAPNERLLRAARP